MRFHQAGTCCARCQNVFDLLQDLQNLYNEPVDLKDDVREVLQSLGCWDHNLCIISRFPKSFSQNSLLGVGFGFE